MKKTMTQFASWMMALTVALVSVHGVYASASVSPWQAGNTFYVSPSGNDANACSLEAPCATFERAIEGAASGDLIVALEGTYMQPLSISKSNITVEGQNAVIIASPHGIYVASGAQNVTVRGFTVAEAESHGIFVEGQSVIVENNIVYHTVLENGSLSGGVITCYNTAWGSAIKIGGGSSNVTVRGNTVYENCGEGIAATRASHVLIENNTVYDNKSVNIYIDNSFNIQALGNNSYCTTGVPMGIALGEENYAGWGAQLHDVTVSNNTVNGCYTGIMVFASDVGGTLTNVTISGNNVPTAQRRGISLDNAANLNVLVSNNVHFNSIWVRSPQGVTLSGNTQVSGTSTPAPTATQTSTPAPTGTVTSTPIKTQPPAPTKTQTPAPTKTQTASPTPTPAETYFDDTHANFVYSANWTKITKSQAYGGSYRETTKNNSSATFTFTGKSFSILYTGGSAYRDINVYVDNVLVGTIHQKTGTKTFKMRWDYTGQLSPETHTLKLVFVTTKATGTKGSIDAVIVR
ncbi:MAG: right-handed parallel beta-helix repeat-containing protein [Chloroflexi bacterium]|nr:right-handed parallel beta-helix repeat-containing protein [Chloroflexota bacterium]